MYITPAGAKRISAELNELMKVGRPKIVREVSEAAAHGDRSENAEYIYGKRKLREIDRRVHFLSKRLDAFVVVDPSIDRGDKVYFGAWVEFESDEGERQRVRIVGEDETDSTRGYISHRSPVARALLGKRLGDEVLLRRPAGDLTVEITRVEYGPE